MTLDEAIKHCEDVVQEKRYEYQECLAVHDIENAEECGRCGEEHRQLAEWLRDYKRLLESSLEKSNKSETKIDCDNEDCNNCVNHKYCDYESNKSEIPTSSTTKNDLALIHTEGLDEGIRCAMCTNSMKTNRGCDGSCVVNNDIYKAVMDVIEKRIQPTTKNNLAVDCISREQALRELKESA